MNTKRAKWVAIAAGVALTLIGAGARAKDTSKDTIDDAVKTVDTFKTKDPSMSKFFNDSVGYVVIPSVGKGGFIVGGAGGHGILFENGNAIGKVSLRQVSVGAQVGGQSYSEIVFFQTPDALADFKRNKTKFSAQTSAVAAAAGASANASYRDGVAIFTYSESGLMAEAAIGSQKFKYQPFKNK